MTSAGEPAARGAAGLAAEAGVPVAECDAAVREYGEQAVREQLERLLRDRAAIDDPALWLRTALAGRFEDMPIERVAACCCGSADVHALSRFVFWNLQGVTGCRTCGAVFASPRLADAAVQRVFAESYFAGDPPAFWGPRRAPVFRQVREVLSAAGARRVLDVGAAYGHLLAYLRDAGIGGSGCDLSGQAVAWGRAQLGLDLHAGTLDGLPAGLAGFDAILSLDALYYAADPMHDLRAMAARMRPGGLLVLRLRNGDRAWRRAVAEGRRAIGRPVMPSEHRWAFPVATMARLLAQAGFGEVRMLPGAHSRTALSPVLDLVGHGNALLRRAVPAVPVLTQSYLAVARLGAA